MVTSVSTNKVNMFNFNDKDGVRHNPLIAKELIKHLSVSEIMSLYVNSHPEE